MLNRIAEIRSCLNNELYEAALALALTLPDICGQVEYPNIGVGQRYRDWITNYMDNTVLNDPVFNGLSNLGCANTQQTFEPLTAADIYKLRCSFLHSGNDDLQQGPQPRIDKFELVKPGALGVDENGRDYGYILASRNENGNQIHVAKINIKYICEMLCSFAEKYYNSKKPELFEDHTWKIGK